MMISLIIINIIFLIYAVIIAWGSYRFSRRMKNSDATLSLISFGITFILLVLNITQWGLGSQNKAWVGGLAIASAILLARVLKTIKK